MGGGRKEKVKGRHSLPLTEANATSLSANVDSSDLIHFSAHSAFFLIAGTKIPHKTPTNHHFWRQPISLSNHKSPFALFGRVRKSEK